MKQKWNGIERRQFLRAQAEVMVASLSPETMPLESNAVLLHELLVHKIELEMQNEELRKVQTALDEALERYTDLYEFAPIGYISVDQDDILIDINLTGSTMLGVERSQLVNLRFSRLVAEHDRDNWYRFFRSILASKTKAIHTLALGMLRSDGSEVATHLHCLSRQSELSSTTVRVALTEIK